MTDLALDPYMQKLVSDYLRDALDSTRVVSDPPDEGRRDTAWVQVVQINVQSNLNDPADRLQEYHIQFNCYAGIDGGKPEAERLARRTWATLRGFPGSHDAPTEDDSPVAVTCVSRLSGPFSLPDVDGFEPARDRFILEAIVYAHSVNT